MLKTKTRKIIFFSIIALILIASIVTAIIFATNYKYSEGYAKRINNAYNSGDPFTYNELMIKYGDPFSKEINGNPSVATGFVEWYKGYSEQDQAKFIKDYRAGKEVKCIYVEFLDGVAVYAEFYITNIENENTYETH